jgi:hypothetical protein
MDPARHPWVRPPWREPSQDSSLIRYAKQTYRNRVHWVTGCCCRLFFSVAEIGVKRLDVDLLAEWAALVNS